MQIPASAEVNGNGNGNENESANVNVHGIYRGGMAMAKRNVNDHVQTSAREGLAHENGQNDLHYVKNVNGLESENVRLPEEYLKQ